MKVLSLCIMFVFASTLVFSQNNVDAKQAKPKKIKVNWKEVGFIVPPDFWDQVESDVKRQVGNNEYEKLKKFSLHTNIPCAMLVFCEDRDGSPLKNQDSLANKMNKLVVYPAANFSRQNDHGTKFDYTVLRVPYAENKNWDPSVQWDTVYFVIEQKYVEQSTYKVQIANLESRL